jgi:hypothetical protein
MTWTTTPPAETGWYWAVRDGRPPECAYVRASTYSPGVMFVLVAHDEYLHDRADFTHWQGPLPEPAPPG